MEKEPIAFPIKSWRYLVIAGLLALPPAVLFALGVVALWRQGQLLWLGWLFPGCWAAAFVLTRWWRKQLAPVPDREAELPVYWTPRDQQAWRLVQQQQEAAGQVSADRLTDPHFYLQSAMDLGQAIARDYHPKATDPFGSVTIPEIMAAAVLAVEETARAFDKYVPGGHLATLDQWRVIAQSPRWFRAVRDTWWVMSLVWNPWNVARYIASRLAMDSASRQLQENARAWLYMVFVRHLGFYLIEMNSGRLRGGVDRYREFRRRLMPQAPVESPNRVADREPELPEPDQDITLALLGKVNAGKSSLINALTDQRQAAVDVLPQTRAVARYRLKLVDTQHQLVLLDTPGYGDGSAAQAREMETAIGQADLVLLVMDVTNPARQVDLEVTRNLLGRYGDRSPRKPPPVIGVLTHIDNLSPTLEWQPPYRWQQPATLKERNIAEAIQYHRVEFGPLLAAVIPVCTDTEHGKAYGVQEQLLPAIVSLLGEARACALLRTLHSELDRNQTRRLFQQLADAGLVLLQSYVLGEARA